MCPHQPLCPSVTSPDHSASHTLAAHPDQGWSLPVTASSSSTTLESCCPTAGAVAPLATAGPITLAARDRGRA
jgi:hypothetical protein